MSLVILLSIFVNLIVEVRQGIWENKGNKTEKTFSSIGCAKYYKIDRVCPLVAAQTLLRVYPMLYRQSKDDFGRNDNNKNYELIRLL